MLEAAFASHIGIVAVLVVLAVALPIRVVRPTTGPADLRERVLRSTPRRVEAQVVDSSAGADEHRV